MNNYKKIIYDNYLSNHNENLYGEKTIAKIIAYFPVCEQYYGKHLPKEKQATILDIGCGDGSFIYWLNQIGYNNTKGIDISQQQISHGKSLGIKNLEFANLFTFLAENTNEYDLIIARDVIEHFTKDEVFEILALINKNLKRQGRLIMQVPNGQGIFYTSVFYGDFTHEMAYTTSSINQIILNTGYRKSVCYPTGPIPKGLVSMMRYIFWNLKVIQLKFWKMVETGSANGIFTQNLIAVIDK